MHMPLIVGTRGSALALWQARHVLSALRAKFPDADFELRTVKTEGDLDQATPLSLMGGSGLFTKQLERALEERSIDLAVHSMKDLPSEIEGLFEIAAVAEREVPWDAFVSEKYRLSDMGRGLLVGTGSLRRVSQLKHAFPNIRTEGLRGNVDTRLRKLREGLYDAIVLAFAGLRRLGLEDAVTDIVPLEISVPAAAQGAIAVEIRAGEDGLRGMLSAIDHPGSRACVEAERSFLRAVEGGCKVPVGCHAIWADQLRITGFIGDLEGSKAVRHTMSFPLGTRDAGEKLAQAMLAMGGEEILSAFRRNGRG